MGKLFVFREDLSVQKWRTAGCGGTILADSNNLKTGQETSGYFTVHLECLSNLAWLLHKGGTTKDITRNWLNYKKQLNKKICQWRTLSLSKRRFFSSHLESWVCKTTARYLQDHHLEYVFLHDFRGHDSAENLHFRQNFFTASHV